MILLLLACSDNNFAEVKLDAIATSMGDFDDVSQVLLSQDIGSAPYNGYIVQGTWDTSDTAPTREDPGNTVEQLVTTADEKGDWIIGSFNAVFINSGTRGLGASVYNDPTTPDDAILTDATAVANVCDFANGGGTLVVTDWAYDIVEACWPDEIEFVGDDTVIDAAQVGAAGDVLADINDQTLTDSVGASAVNVTYDYSAWAVIEDVTGDVEVLMSGDVTYQKSDAEGYDTLTDVPLLVRFVAGGGNGRVIFGTFPWLRQNGAVGQSLLLGAVEGLTPGAGSQSAEASGG